MSPTRARLALRLKSCCRPSRHVRCRHDLPHKEYFQNPSTHPAAEAAGPEPPSTEHLLSRRLLRSVLWAGLFGTLGFAYVEVLKTAKWMDKSKGDPKREETDMQEIKRKFTDDPLVKILDADPSWENAQQNPHPETDPHPLVQHADRYMATAMGGSRGVQARIYFNQSKKMMCCIIHVGEGLEWGPRTAHAGGLASFIEDFLDWLGTGFTEVVQGRGDTNTAIMSHKSLHVDFLDDVPTGQLYALWMVPAFLLGDRMVDVLTVKELQGPKITKAELRRTVVGMLERRDSLPYEPGNSQKYARARVTYDAGPTK